MAATLEADILRVRAERDQQQEQFNAMARVGISQEQIILDLQAERDALREALRGMLAIQDSVTQGQERELRAEWLPKARDALAKAKGETDV